MSAQTPTDIQNLIDGSDFKSAIIGAAGVEINGVRMRSFGESLDINGRSARVSVSPIDAARFAIGAAIEVDSINYTVRAIETGDDLSTLVLEVA